jgi:DNA-binding transcriptional LysR family regulator
VRAAPGAGRLLTPTGKLLLDRARRLLPEAAELSYAVRGNGTELVGPLAVGCFLTLAPTVLPRLLAEYGQLHPQVTVDFVEGSEDQLKEALLAGEIDVAVLYDMGQLDALDRSIVARGSATRSSSSGRRTS